MGAAPLDPGAQIAISPDYRPKRPTLVTIALLARFERRGEATQGVPSRRGNLDACERALGATRSPPFIVRRAHAPGL
jgi:hypothetical protein